MMRLSRVNSPQMADYPVPLDAPVPGTDEDTDDLVIHGVTDPQLRQLRMRRVFIYIGRIVLIAAVLASWQYFGPKIGKIFASSPSDAFKALKTLEESGRLWTDLWATMEEVILGYLAGAAAGILVGAILSISTMIAGLFDPFIIGFYSLPKIAFGPIFVVWLGIGLAPKVSLAAISVFFFVFFSTYQGLTSVDQRVVEAVRLMGASETQIRRYVTFPAARPSIFLGLKLGVPQALLGAIVGEFVAASKGIGYEIQFATAQLDTAGVFASLFVLLVVSVILNALVNRASGRSRMGKS